MDKAQARAVRLLAVRDRTEHELKDRLQRAGFTDETITEAVAWCHRLGYIDDGRFARQWVEYRMLHSQSGHRRLRVELRQKGVDETVIDSVLSEMLPPEREQQLCIEAAARRARRYRDQPADVRERRLTSFLARRGFSYDTIRLALTQVDTHSNTD